MSASSQIPKELWNSKTLSKRRIFYYYYYWYRGNDGFRVDQGQNIKITNKRFLYLGVKSKPNSTNWPPWLKLEKKIVRYWKKTGSPPLQYKRSNNKYKSWDVVVGRGGRWRYVRATDRCHLHHQSLELQPRPPIMAEWDGEATNRTPAVTLFTKRNGTRNITPL